MSICWHGIGFEILAERSDCFLRLAGRVAACVGEEDEGGVELDIDVGMFGEGVVFD